MQVDGVTLLAVIAVGNRIDQQFAPWARLLKLAAELALISQATDDVKQRWPSVRRSLEEQIAELREPQIVQLYGFLMLGLVSYLSADILIDEECDPYQCDDQDCMCRGCDQWNICDGGMCSGGVYSCTHKDSQIDERYCTRSVSIKSRLWPSG